MPGVSPPTISNTSLDSGPSSSLDELKEVLVTFTQNHGIVQPTDLKEVIQNEKLDIERGIFMDGKL